MAEEKKRLYRSRSDRWLAGVCGGIGDYFDTDPTVIRVIFVLAALIMGGGLLIYLILWLIIPLEPEAIEAVEEVPADEGE
ncbi:MAG: PspC domain-containing protein [Chloroflexi bacterium]|nr:PspC domain-containing protein [Chloroflexota bacterium]